jgi:TPR repeat protein
MKPATLLAVPALLALLSSVSASGAGVTAAPATARAPGGGTVLVSGERDPASARYIIDSSTSRVLSREFASSCAFMSAWDPAYDPAAVAYMHEFYDPDSMHNGFATASEYAPTGDVSNTWRPSRIDGLRPRTRFHRGTGGMPGAGASACGPADWRFAAGRAHILRMDKSLGEAFQAMDRKDYAAALALFKTAWSKIGYETAALTLGQLYLHGLGTAKDSRQAISWFEEVAYARYDPRMRVPFNPANPYLMTDRMQAAFTLARIYESGDGVPADPARARKWYAEAAKFGYVPALDILGRDWLEGRLGPRDRTRAMDYLTQAAQAGYAPAQYLVGKMHYLGTGDVAPDLKLAGAYFEAAARAGHPGALFAVGRMYDLGTGVPADPDKALVYYKEAALKGDRDARFALGTYFYSGERVPKDTAIARRWFDAAAHQGQADAMYSLGAMFSNGEGGPPDLMLAYVWLNLAKTAGHDGAAAALAVVAPRLSTRDRARANAILAPVPPS